MYHRNQQWPESDIFNLVFFQSYINLCPIKLSLWSEADQSEQSGLFKSLLLVLLSELTEWSQLTFSEQRHVFSRHNVSHGDSETHSNNSLTKIDEINRFYHLLDSCQTFLVELKRS